MRVLTLTSYDIRDEFSSGIYTFLSGIQKRHIYYKNIRFFFFCDFPPLNKDFIIIASETINAFNYQ